MWQQIMTQSKRSLKFLKRLPGVQPPATFRLNELLVERGDTDALRAYADAGEFWAAHRLVDVLAERGDSRHCAPALTPATLTPPVDSPSAVTSTH